MKKLAAISLLSWCPLLLAASDTIPTTHGNIHLSYENLTLPGAERMGLSGGGFLYDVTPWFAVGPSAYGAITGHRGGFITLGGTTQISQKISDYLHVEGGFFIGAGGGDGGYVLVGGGLMLRSNLGVLINLHQFGSLGIGGSYITFPNGHITSVQPYFAYQYAFDTLLADGWIPPLRGSGSESVPSAEREFAMVYKSYQVSGNPQFNQPIDLLGVEWNCYLNPHLFFKIESEGAMGGQSSGYMQILLGGGLRQALTSRTFVKLAAQLGVAGGGAVPTGGGLLLDGAVSLQQYLTPAVYIALTGGYTDAPTGRFKSPNIGVTLGYDYAVPDVHGGLVEISALQGYFPQPLRIRATNQTYFQASPQWRYHHVNEPVNSLGLQIDYFAKPWLYLTGQGLGAYQGNAGAYMIGLLGPGLHLPFFHTPLFFNLEGLIGAAGGGGLNVGGGFVWQGNSGLGLQLTPAWSLQGYYGYISAVNGPFKANVLGLAVGYHFTGFTK